MPLHDLPPGKDLAAGEKMVKAPNSPAVAMQNLKQSWEEAKISRA